MRTAKLVAPKLDAWTDVRFDFLSRLQIIQIYEAIVTITRRDIFLVLKNLIEQNHIDF